MGHQALLQNEETIALHQGRLSGFAPCKLLKGERQSSSRPAASLSLVFYRSDLAAQNNQRSNSARGSCPFVGLLFHSGSSSLTYDISAPGPVSPHCNGADGGGPYWSMPTCRRASYRSLCIADLVIQPLARDRFEFMSRVCGPALVAASDGALKWCSWSRAPS